MKTGAQCREKIRVSPKPRPRLPPASNLRPPAFPRLWPPEADVGCVLDPRVWLSDVVPRGLRTHPTVFRTTAAARTRCPSELKAQSSPAIRRGCFRSAVNRTFGASCVCNCRASAYDKSHGCKSRIDSHGLSVCKGTQTGTLSVLFLAAARNRQGQHRRA